jgi:hypothetical protein
MPLAVAEGSSDIGWLRKRWFDIFALGLVGFITVTAPWFAIPKARGDYTRRARADHLPKSGMISGKNAKDGKEWEPGSWGNDSPFVVLFTLSPPNKTGNREYWQSVVLRVKALDSRIKFVGLCPSEIACEDATSTSDGIVYLTAMDPLQMRALAVANKQGVALLYRYGTLSDRELSLSGGQTRKLIVGKLLQPLPITSESQNLVDQLIHGASNSSMALGERAGYMDYR